MCQPTLPCACQERLRRVLSAGGSKVRRASYKSMRRHCTRLQALCALLHDTLHGPSLLLICEQEDLARLAPRTVVSFLTVPFSFFAHC